MKTVREVERFQVMRFERERKSLVVHQVYVDESEALDVAENIQERRNTQHDVHASFGMRGSLQVEFGDAVESGREAAGNLPKYTVVAIQLFFRRVFT